MPTTDTPTRVEQQLAAQSGYTAGLMHGASYQSAQDGITLQATREAAASAIAATSAGVQLQAEHAIATVHSQHRSEANQHMATVTSMEGRIGNLRAELDHALHINQMSEQEATSGRATAATLREEVHQFRLEVTSLRSAAVSSAESERRALSEAHVIRASLEDNATERHKAIARNEISTLRGELHQAEAANIRDQRRLAEVETTVHQLHTQSRDQASLSKEGLLDEWAYRSYVQSETVAQHMFALTAETTRSTVLLSEMCAGMSGLGARVDDLNRTVTNAARSTSRASRRSTTSLRAAPRVSLSTHSNANAGSSGGRDPNDNGDHHSRSYLSTGTGLPTAAPHATETLLAGSPFSGAAQATASAGLGTARPIGEAAPQPPNGTAHASYTYGTPHQAIHDDGRDDRRPFAPPPGGGRGRSTQGQNAESDDSSDDDSSDEGGPPQGATSPPPPPAAPTAASPADQLIDVLRLIGGDRHASEVKITYLPTGANFRGWRTHSRQAIITASGRPREGQIWIDQVETLSIEQLHDDGEFGRLSANITQCLITLYREKGTGPLRDRVLQLDERYAINRQLYLAELCTRLSSTTTRRMNWTLKTMTLAISKLCFTTATLQLSSVTGTVFSCTTPLTLVSNSRHIT